MGKSKTLIIAVPMILVLFGLVVYQYGYLSVKADMEAVKEEQAVKQGQLKRYVAIIEDKPQFEKKIAQFKETLRAENAKLIEGQTPSIAAAKLQEDVRAIITGRSGTISSERVAKPEDLGKFKIITVVVDAVLPDTRALSDMVYSIETHTPQLVIKELDVRVRNFNDPKELMVKIDVSALTGGSGK